MHHKFFGEVLPYLEVKKQDEEASNIRTIEMPNITGVSIKEAKKILKEHELEIDIQGVNENDTNIDEKIIIDQTPKKGIKINSGSKVITYVQ